MKPKPQSLALSSVISGLTLVFMTIYAELSETFKKFLTNLTTHHWISKSILTILIFIIVYYLSSIFFKNSSPKSKYIYLIIIFAIICYILIFVFFLYEWLSK